MKSAAKGKPEAVAREMLLQEYRKRGVKPLPQPLLDNVVASISTDDPVILDRLLSERKALLREQLSLFGRALKEILP